MTVLPPRFELRRVLVEGDAEVVVARDVELDRDVVVKLLSAAAAADPELRRRFRREARVAAQLGAHPHVVTVHESGAWEGRPYIVFELLAGGSLADRVRGGGIRVEDALRWLAQAASALDAVHDAGFVHRDVKPANLLLDERDELRLADFGVVRDVREAITEAGVVLGTPAYLAPEQARGETTPATDVHALAAVAHELLSGRRWRDGATLVGGATGAVLARALAEDPGRRFASATAFVEALAAAVDAREAGTRRLVAIPRTRALRVVPAPPGRRISFARVLAYAAAFAAVAATAALAGIFVALRAVDGSPRQAAPAVVRSSCTASPVDRDANVVVSGTRPERLCRSLASALASGSVVWTYRSGRVLLAPDHGSDALSVVCRLRRGALAVTVYDSGAQQIGRSVCDSRLGPSWNEGSVT